MEVPPTDSGHHIGRHWFGKRYHRVAVGLSGGFLLWQERFVCGNPIQGEQGIQDGTNIGIEEEMQWVRRIRKEKAEVGFHMSPHQAEIISDDTVVEMTGRPIAVKIKGGKDIQTTGERSNVQQ